MSQPFLHLRGISHAYCGASAPVFEALDLTLPSGWTGVVGANGSGKSTLLHLVTGLLHPSSGRLRVPPGALLCAQRTDAPPLGLAALLEGADGPGWRWRDRLGIQKDWLGRWDTLSHGERKRAQLAVALWEDPPLLAVDEPTNHLDASTVRLLREALAAYRGIGLLVSHDRDLLDALCDQCIFLKDGAGTLRPGGYSDGTLQGGREQAARLREREALDREVGQLQETQHRRREQTAKAERDRSKRGLDPGDRDGRARVDAARVADGKSGAGLRQLDGRLAQAREKQATATLTRAHVLGVQLKARSAPRPQLVVHPGGMIPLGPGRYLEVPALVVRPADRIGLTGPNGAGKSTFLRALLATSTLPADFLVHLPQELGAADSRAILRTVQALPRDVLGRVMALISHLGSDPARLLQSQEPSPGELRKLLLAKALGEGPCLLVLDEPTNHLDLPSVACLEEALSACDAALILVSHDARFLDRLTTRRWHLEPQGRDGGRMSLQET